MSMRSVLLFLGIFSLSVFSSPLIAMDDDGLLSPERKIAHYLKSVVIQKNDEDVKHMMNQHFSQLRFMDQQGNWRSEKFKAISETLLPENIGTKDLIYLIECMAEGASHNNYLQAVLKEATSGAHDLSQFYARVEKEGGEILPNVIAYALVLENLTKAMRKDVGLLKEANVLWDEEKKNIFIPYYFGPFEAIKLFSLRRLQPLITPCETKSASPSIFNIGLPVNVLEASVSDYAEGNSNNAWAGLALVQNPPSKARDKRTGAKPGELVQAEDGPEIRVYPHFPKLWKDLYGVWNLGFMTTFTNYPYFMTKLLIPQVSGATKDPGAYLHNRLIALYIHVHFELYGRVYSGKSAYSMNWKNKALTNVFGIANYKSAQHYKQQIREATEA